MNTLNDEIKELGYALKVDPSLSYPEILAGSTAPTYTVVIPCHSSLLSDDMAAFQRAAVLALIWVDEGAIRDNKNWTGKLVLSEDGNGGETDEPIVTDYAIERNLPESLLGYDTRLRPLFDQYDSELKVIKETKDPSTEENRKFYLHPDDLNLPYLSGYLIRPFDERRADDVCVTMVPIFRVDNGTDDPSVVIPQVSIPVSSNRTPSEFIIDVLKANHQHPAFADIDFIKQSVGLHLHYGKVIGNILPAVVTIVP